MENAKDIKLSIIILVYNTEHFLHQCFDSLVNQTLKGIEIIAIDDESSDNSLKICQEYEEKYNNFKVITQKNQGGAAASIRGLKEANGEYVAIVDSDDFLPLDAYSILYKRAKESNADISIGRPMRYLNKQYLEVILPEERAVWEEDRVLSSHKEIRTLFHDKFYWNKIFKREFIDQNNIYMPRGYLYADFLMVHKAYELAKTITITNKVTYFWRRDIDKRAYKSASQEIASCDNFKERIKSLLYRNSKDKDISFKMDDLKLLLLSFVFNDIVEQLTFRKTFLEGSQEVLKKVDSIQKHDIHPYTKLRLWLIANNHINELFYLLGKNPKNIIYISNGKTYCKLPFFDNNDLNIPKEIFEYKRLRPEMIKNFLYIDNGNTFTFQVLLHGCSRIESRTYYLFFKDKTGKTFYKYELEQNGDYYSCNINKNELFQDYTRLFVGIGDNDNIIYRLKKANCEPNLDTRKKFSYIVRFSGNTKELFFEKRNLPLTIKRKIKKVL